MDNKQHLAPHEWYGYRRKYPDRYRIIMTFIRESNYAGYRHPGWNYEWVPLPINPRTWFTPAQMLLFLIKYRHLKAYKLIRFTPVMYKGKESVRIGWDVPRERMCDYFWSEVKEVLALLENLLSSEKGT